MTSLDDHRLLEVARAIDDELPIDWHAAEGSMSDAAGRALILQLQVLHGMARVARDPEGALTTLTAPDALGGEAPLEPHTHWGPLTVLGPIGHGAFGHVYRARDNLQHEIALKLFQDAARSPRLLREGRLLARVRHPNVVMVHGAAEHNGQVGLWMELIRGRTLEDELRSRGAFSAEEARLIGLDLCRALAAVHEAGLVHRDVKAQNVMREIGGRIVLMDFGAGTDAQAGAHSVRDIAGTPMYLPPEAFAGESASRQWDIYSLGVLLFHLVTDAFPVSGSNRVEVERAHAERQVRLLRDARPDLPEGFVRVVEAALERDPRRRYHTAGEMERALLNPGAAVPAPIAPRPLWWRWAALSVLPIVLAVLLAIPAVRERVFGKSAAPAGSPQPEAFAPPAVRAETRYTIGGAFYRYADGRRVRVSHGDRVRPGDSLGCQIEASIPVFVYVVNEDDHGEAYLLFPLPGQETQNPLSGGTTHDLPGGRDGQNVHWQVTSAGGREHFVVLVSPTPLSVFDGLFDTLAHPTTGRQVREPRLPESTVSRLRGVGGLVSTPSSTGPGTHSLFEGAGLLGTKADTATGIWIRQLTLENPGS